MLLILLVRETHSSRTACSAVRFLRLRQTLDEQCYVLKPRRPELAVVRSLAETPIPSVSLG